MAITWANNGGFSDIQPGIVPLDELAQMLDLAAPLYPRYWRIMAAWNYIALEPDPGDPVASPPSYGTGTTAYAPPTTTNRDWSSIDRCINEIIRTTGAEIIMMVGQNRPKYGSHHGGGASGFFGLFSGAASLLSGGLFGALTSSSSKVTADDYGSFAAEVATRYKVGGVGIAPDLAARGKGVRIFEAWNEENSKYTWVKNVDTKMYFEYLQAFYNSVKAVPGLSGSASEVMFGSLTHVPDGAFWYGQGWITDQEADFMSKLYALGAQPYFDSVGIHPYTTQDAKRTGYSPDLADDAWLQAVSIHNSMVANGDGSKPVHITELGYATSMCTEQQQSDFHEATLALINANFPWVSSYLVYCFKDSGTNKKALNQTLGCFWHDLSPKILYSTLLTMSVQAAAFNLGVTLSLGDTGAPGPGHGSVNLGVTTGIGMTGVGRSPASMNVGVTLGIGMTAVEHDGGQFNLGVTLGITQTPAGLTPASMNIGVTTGVAMSAVEHNAGAFNIGVTCGIGMTGADKEAGSFNLGVTTGVGMSGALPAAGSMNVGVTCGIGMTAKMSYDYNFATTAVKPADYKVGTPSIVAHGAATGASLAPPTGYAPGDLIIYYAFRDGSTTVPTADTNYTSYDTATGTSCSIRLSVRLALSTSEPTPTFTNATGVVCVIARGVDIPTTLHADSAKAAGSGTGGTITYPALTLARNNNTSLVVRFAGQRDATNITTNAPTGYTQVDGVATVVCAVVANAIATGNPASGTQSTNGTTGWIAYSMELFAAVPDFGMTEPTTISTGNNLREGDSDVAVSAVEYYEGWIYPDPMQTTTYHAQAVMANLTTGSSRGIGVCVAVDDVPTRKAVFAIGNQLSATPGYQILTYDGATFTQQASLASGSSSGSGDQIGCRITQSGGIYTYTLTKNGVDTSVTWTDSTSIIGTPSKRWGAAFHHTRVNGVQGPSPGISEVKCVDS